MGAPELPVDAWEGVWAPEQAATQLCPHFILHRTDPGRCPAPHTRLSTRNRARVGPGLLTCGLTFLDGVFLLLISKVSGAGQTTQSLLCGLHGVCPDSLCDHVSFRSCAEVLAICVLGCSVLYVWLSLFRSS